MIADDVVMRVAAALMARWEDQADPTRNHLTIIAEDPRTVASVALTAAREDERCGWPEAHEPHTEGHGRCDGAAPSPEVSS